MHNVESAEVYFRTLFIVLMKYLSLERLKLKWKRGNQMREIPSTIEGKQYDLYKLEQILKPLGYTIGGNWDYDHGSFDYKIDDEDGYQFLRVPFKSIDGQLDARNCTVQLQTPFLLSHMYQSGIDNERSDIGNASASFNQFQEPVDKDASFPDKYIDLGKSLVKELESALET
jgi:hypothetical protein